MRRSRRGKEPEYELDPEIDRTYHLRNQARILIERNNYLVERLEAMVNKRQRNVADNINNNNNNNPTVDEDPPIDAQNNRQPPAAPAARQTCREYMDNDHVELQTTLPDVEAEHFELKPIMFSMINSAGQFGGSATEDAREHLKTFSGDLWIIQTTRNKPGSTENQVISSFIEG
ncbi:hypothetical protein HRI_005285100 [Hibiscus trionum]|uniref:Uncharacterized protein n=1 Tax=Hibiscus trionum TaxID=183268 RepID=A0A9W7JLM2_HIBTR|nr:hypothetical protein HRI_005285100 [Hibiscus trionum]